MLNLAFVRSFVALAETGSFRGAAERLDLAQPTISQHLRKLEAAMGAPLIERSHARSRPTRQGLLALPVARSLLETAERMRAVLSETAVLIGASGNIAGYYLPRALARFAEAEGGLPDWRIVQAPNPDLAERLEAGEIDLAVTEWPVTAPGIVATPWCTEELLVIVSPEHPLAGRDEIGEAEFLALPLIGGERGSGTATLLRAAFGTAADRLRAAPSVGSTEAVKSAVMAGLGASLVLSGAVVDELEAGRLRGLRIAGRCLAKTFYLCHADGLPETAWAVRLSRFLSEAEPQPGGGGSQPPVRTVPSK